VITPTVRQLQVHRYKAMLERRVTSYDLFRRRLAPVMFAGAIALIAYDAYNKRDHATATFVIELGPAEPSVTAVDAELWMGGEQVAKLHRVALSGHAIGPVEFKQTLPGHDGELRIDVEQTTGHTKLVRHFHADNDATVRFPLEHDLK
jgi:hypothetical protein